MDFICWCFQPEEIDFAEGKDLVIPPEYINHYFPMIYWEIKSKYLQVDVGMVVVQSKSNTVKTQWKTETIAEWTVSPL